MCISKLINLESILIHEHLPVGFKVIDLRLYQTFRYWDFLSASFINGVPSWSRPSEAYYSISQEICTRFCCALLCCGYAIVHEFTWSIYYLYIYINIYIYMYIYIYMQRLFWILPNFRHGKTIRDADVQYLINNGLIITQTNDTYIFSEEFPIDFLPFVMSLYISEVFLSFSR